MIVTRARYERDTAALRADVDRLRGERDAAVAERETAVFNRKQILDQLAAADGANRRLYGRNVELGDRINALAQGAPQHTAKLHARVNRLLKAIERLGAIAVAERRRADRLQQRLDDAVGLPKAGIHDSARWQPGYVEPKADAS